MTKFNPRYSHSGLLRVPSYKPGKPIEELERELGIRKAVKMASNENPFGPSPLAMKAAKAMLGRVNRYPDANAFDLKKALASKHGVSPDRVILGNGSDELIVLALRAFVAPREEVLTARPTFLIYGIAAKVIGARLKEVPMKAWRYDLQSMARAVRSQTRIIFIANPDNPVGTYVRKNELSVFLRNVPANCLVFIDEAYFEFAKREKGYPDGTKFLQHPNVIVSRTFSKAYGLAGLRVGYALAHPAVIEGMNKVREPFNVNSVAQTAALAALKDTRFLKRVLSVTLSEKRKLTKFLGATGIETLPSATNFLLMRLGIRARTVYEALLKKGIIVRSMASWGLSEYLRVTVGKHEENNKFIRALKDVIT